MTKKCVDCGAEIGEQYEFCYPCVKKRNIENKKLKQSEPSKEIQSESSKEIVSELGRLNNNLYYLRLGVGVILKEQYKITITWDKTKKDFVINKK